jgi:hypothetical protein
MTILLAVQEKFTKYFQQKENHHQRKEKQSLVFLGKAHNKKKSFINKMKRGSRIILIKEISKMSKMIVFLSQN